MIGRKATAGLALACALLFSAFAAQSAFALKGTHATNTTAVTCVEGKGNLDFSDAHCDNKVTAGTGKFGHVEIKAGETTEIETTMDKTNDDTTGFYSAVLTSTHLGVNVEITCEAVSNHPEGKNWIENRETVSKEHTVHGTVDLQFEKCKVLKPANCTVPNIRTKASFKGVEEVGGAPSKAMGLEFVEDEGEFATIQFSGEKCAFKEKSFPVKGSAIATGKPANTEKHSGATTIFTDAADQTLKFSTSAATFKARFTTKMKGGNPIALTTTT